MQLKVGNRIVDKFNNIAVSLRYDSVASSFAAMIYTDPANDADRQTFVPGNYNIAVLTHNGETLITGVMLNSGTSSEAVEQLTRVGGYSKTGVLDDCMNMEAQAQFIGMSLSQICTALIKPYGLTVTVDDVVKDVCNSPITTNPTLEPDAKIKDIITQLAIGLNVVLTHDAKGNLVLTRADTTKAPIYDFYDGGLPQTKMSVSFDGQEMHSVIKTVGQSSIGVDNASDNSVTNPYVQQHVDWMGTALLSTLGKGGVSYSTGYRPRVYVQNSGNDNDTPLTARQILSQELMNITLKIELSQWELNGKLVKPNNIVTVTSPKNWLYQKSRWFIESVDLYKDEKKETAILNCVLPECYNNDKVINVFTGSNLTIPYVDPTIKGAHATITPFI